MTDANVKFNRRSMVKIGFIFVATIMLSIGCSSGSKSLKAFDENIKNPQLIVAPETISLGVATIMGTDIIFKGRGFGPKEKIMLVLRGIDEKNKEVEITLGFGKTGEDGNFTEEVDKMSKVFNILRADAEFLPDDKKVLLISIPPIPGGIYEATAVGNISDRKAKCTLTFQDPTIMDKIKDFVGRVFLGKMKKDEDI